ncbi:hypothetical protein D1007_38914 [Hordeum vulgare]|nr:hypothetical protein D1007_38914 [Hordeum vulgare]
MSAIDTRRLFDKMPTSKKRKSVPPVSAMDHISALPDHILHHMLSFLPAQLAVQTCVLARRWRHLWRSTTGLRIHGLDNENSVKVKDLRKFVDHLLILRERTHLDTVQIAFNEYDDDDLPDVNLWIRFAVMCKVRVLTLHILQGFYLDLDDLRLVSRHLVTLDLLGVALQKRSLDFTSCSALEDLKMNECKITADRISSHSLKHLSISYCYSDSIRRVRISAPGLVSLKLQDFIGITPFLEDMPLLQAAYVNLGSECMDFCLNYDYGVSYGANNNTCENCVPINNDCSRECVILSGISNAKHLELISEFGMFIFRRDLNHCPTFSKLRTLLLNEYWCETRDLDRLACILKNSPVLEKLTLQLFSKGPNHKVEIKGSYSSVEKSSAISKHLNIVEVKCDEIDERILNVLKFLYAFNIWFSFV